MTANDLPIKDRIALVRAAIQRIKDAEKHHRDTQADAYSDYDDRALAREGLRECERKFSWQWKNVEAILDELDRMAAS